MDYPNKKSNNSDLTTPICRCRVIYLGYSVPHLCKEGLQGVQEPLKELYPETGISGLNSSTGAGIDSILSVWSNGILIENVDDFGREVRKFFPIESLHYCAAVRFLNTPDSTKFLPLDSPCMLRMPKSDHPPLFACILRRTTGIKVLECHAFVCKREVAANALVRCCFHSYADNEYVKQMDERESPYAQINNRNEQQKTNKDQVDGVKYATNNWGDVTDLTDSDNTGSTQPTQKLNSIQNHHSISATTKSAKKSLNDTNKTKKPGKTNGFTNGNPELNSDDTEIMTTNSSISQNSPVEEEDVALINNSYKTIWSTSKSLSGSVKNLNLSSKEAAKIAKGASMRSLRPRQMVMPNMLGAPISFVPIHAMPHPQLIPHPQLLEKPSKGTNKLLKKMSKSKSMITLVPQPTSTPIPPHAIPISHLPPHQQMMFLNATHQQGIYGHLPPQSAQILPQMIPIPSTPQPITGNIHSIKKKSKKNKEKQLLQQQLSELQFLAQHQGQPILIPPMRPLTPLTNYLDSNQKYLVQTIGPQNTTSIYHTAPRNRKELEKLNKKLNKKGDKLSAINADELQAMINNQNNLNNYHNKQSSKQQSNSNSPFNTGIYRKKGHLMNINERAFSYSIRQEHRSRSNSVANLNFNQDEVDHLQPANYLPSDHPQQEQLHGQSGNNKARKLSQNGSAILNNSNSSQGSPQALSKQQQLARQQQQQQQYYLHQQQSLTDALNNLQINGQLNQPKTASIKRSKLNNNNLIFHNGQINGNAKLKNGYDTASNQMMSAVPPVFNGKFVLPTQNV